MPPSPKNGDKVWQKISSTWTFWCSHRRTTSEPLTNLYPSIWVIFKDCSSRESHCWRPQSHRCTNCLTGSIGPLRAIVSISYSTRDHVHRYAHDPDLSRCTACYLQHPVYPEKLEPIYATQPSPTFYRFEPTQSNLVQSIISSKIVWRLSWLRIKMKLVTPLFFVVLDTLIELFWRFTNQKGMNHDIGIEVIKGKSKASKFTIICVTYKNKIVNLWLSNYCGLA